MAIGISALLQIVPVASAQDAAPATPALLLELNAAQPSEKGCRLTFVVTNELAAPLSKAAFEIALFDAQGRVDRLTVLDFNTLPAGKTKVVRFDLSGSKCDNVGRVLVNEVTACEGEGIEPRSCITALKPSSRLPITFGL